MKLQRPILFFDLETTGIDTVNDRIVEISVLKHHIDGTTEIKTKRINPGTPIPAEATEIHGITDKDVQDEPKFSQLAQGIALFMDSCDLGGYNVLSFDLPMLSEEFARCGIQFPGPDLKVIDVYKIFAINEPRTLEGAYRRFCGKELEGAHGAEADIKATHEVFLAQLEEYDLPGTVEELDTFCKDGVEFIDLAGKIVRNEAGDLVFGFGKHKGKRIVDEESYVEWMLSGSFSSNTKEVLGSIVGGELT